MAELFYLNRQTRDDMQQARKYILKAYQMIKQGSDLAACWYALRAVKAHNRAIHLSGQDCQASNIKLICGLLNVLAEAA